MNEKPKSKLRWRLLRWGLIGLAVLATLAALLVTEENWRGKHAWENYKRAAEARGEKLDLASIIPPTVPDDQNFFCAPIVAEALLHSNNRALFRIYRGDDSLWPTNGMNWQKGELTQLKEWQAYFANYNATPEGRTNGFPASAQPQSPPADVLTALSCYNPALEKLRQAAQRPEAQLPADYNAGFDVVNTIMLPLGRLKVCVQFLELRAVAELQDGQGAAALADIKLLLRMNDSIHNQPLLVSHLFRVAVQAIALQPIYEGLTQHRWNDPQLADVENTLAAEDFLTDFKTAMHGEKICAINEFERQRITRKMEFRDNNEHPVTVSMRAMPEAFFYMNKFWFAQWNDRFTAQVDVTNRMISPAAFARLDVEVESQKKHYSIYKVQALMAVPAVGNVVEKFAHIQAQVDLARVACALERFRLAHGNYPDTLDALTPQFIEKLPHDIINGQPLHYRLEPNGQFVLYSVGWNETDDGGKVEFTKSGRIDSERGDWVWKY
jgi:hypothetical protein